MPRNIQVHHFVGAVQHRSAVLVILVEDIAPDFHYFILNCKPCCKKKKGFSTFTFLQAVDIVI